MTFLSRLLTRWRDRPDPGLSDASVKFGTKPVRAEWQTYDQHRAVLGRLESLDRERWRRKVEARRATAGTVRDFREGRR